ncbi:carboxylesterase family protein [Neptunitalea lumnitzerae]|uniref:Phospholipase n=1 Tax=Neptunitalea lumnitzerae TaxID=2965509 RepID=A0ABQ5MEB5_9FLAO|nr:prolyl oligopeptidase family serine peptidase [Neptunitalea sp. Y10]GLB47651.1 phospholipase [Neptunitalea sp. Y10]
MNKYILILLLLVTAGLTAQNTFNPATWGSGEKVLNYQILYPENFSESQEYPVVLFLHGAGERGSNNTSQLVNGSQLFLSDSIQKQHPAIVIFPQCPKEDYWANADIDRSSYPLNITFKTEGAPTQALSMVMDLMDDMAKKPYVKKDQIYVMGLSMGGMGTFEILYRKPEMFAAAIAICGGAHPETAAAYATKIPLWIFHGSHDNVVAPQHSINMVSSILENGGFPQFTLFANSNHNSWDPTFAQPGLLTWLFSKHKQQTNTTK